MKIRGKLIAIVSLAVAIGAWSPAVANAAVVSTSSTANPSAVTPDASGGGCGTYGTVPGVGIFKACISATSYGHAEVSVYYTITGDVGCYPYTANIWNSSNFNPFTTSGYCASAPSGYFTSIAVALANGTYRSGVAIPALESSGTYEFYSPSLILP